ncbi:MAG: hypothetical protein ACJ8C4_21360 [Gemmataceae bacterium]
MRYLFSATAAIVLTLNASAADISPLIAKIKAVGPDGVGSVEAAAAWKQLSHQGLDSVIPILSAIDGASPLAANWLCSAVDAVIERAGSQPLPSADLEKFLANRSHAARARRLAYELICRANPTAPESWLPRFFDDPAPELRFVAVKSAFEKVKGAPKEDAAAIKELDRLLQASRNFDQIEEIAKALDDRGEKRDLTDHFGFLKSWHVIGPFDNANGTAGFAQVFPPETKVDLNAELPGKAGPVKWQVTTSTAQYAPIDLNKVLGKHKNAVAYAYAEVNSPEAEDVEVRVASATGVKAFVNGKEVLARESYHQGMTPDSHIAAVRLQKGRNTILVKIVQNDEKMQHQQEWQFQLRVTDASGAKAKVEQVSPVTAK